MNWRQTYERQCHWGTMELVKSAILRQSANHIVNYRWWNLQQRKSKFIFSRFNIFEVECIIVHYSWAGFLIASYCLVWFIAVSEYKTLMGYYCPWRKMPKNISSKARQAATNPLSPMNNWIIAACAGRPFVEVPCRVYSSASANFFRVLLGNQQLWWPSNLFRVLKRNQRIQIKGWFLPEVR